MQLPVSFLIGTFVALFSMDAMACADTLYRVGKNVSYREYTAPLPGSVLVYGQSEGARQLAEALIRAGHGVRFVDNAASLTFELSTGQYDVVIAPFSSREMVQASARASGNTRTAFIPVAQTRDEEKIANQTYSRVMAAERDEIKHYLRAIHKTLKEKNLVEPNKS